MIASTTSETILVVDDHESLCEMMEVILGRCGYHVLTATNGDDALQLARKMPKIDLLVTDIEMPGMQGGELAMRLAVLHPAAQVVFVSSTAAPPMKTPTEFLTKPFSVADLRDAARRALSKRPELGEAAHAS